MRRGQNPSFLRDKKGQLLGVDLSADYVSEHEWGIAELRRDFSLPAAIGERLPAWSVKPAADVETFGIERRRATPPASDFALVEDGKTLAYCPTKYLGCTLEELMKRYHKHDLVLRGPVAAAWDSKNFAVRVDDSGKAALAEIHQAFLNRDGAIWVGGGSVFENAGLVLAIISRIPADRLAAMEEADRDRTLLLATAAATGVEELLTAAGKRWFALAPRWTNDKKKTVGFWLNPMDQDIHNSRWCTVEELKQWAQNKGPVMKTHKRRL